MGSSFLSPPAKKRSILHTETGFPDPNPYYAANGSSSKRSKSKHPPPPLTIPPGHVAFRLLCQASRIGGVIGKSGAVIQNLQQVTGAKIRVEDAPSESPDRVIVVIAPSALTAKVFLGAPSPNSDSEDPEDDDEDYGGGGGGVEVSKAQEALLKVFEKILDVAVESEGVQVEDGIVSCRLLADDSQVGSVIGKGGKVVEKIRKDSGCKIKVLSDKLPSCTAPSEKMVEIEGYVQSVKKALLAVSRCLQDFPPPSRTKMMGSKPHEVVQHESLAAVPHDNLTVVPRDSLPVRHADLLLPRGSVLSTIPSSYASGVHSVSAEVPRVSALDPMTHKQEVSFRILCSNDRVGGVIGKGGSIIRALQNETGATISIGPSVEECEDRLITVTASENLESRYSAAQKAAVLVFSRSVEAGIEKGLDSGSKGSSVAARLVVSSNQVGCLLGKGGSIITEMRKATGTSIKIMGTDQAPKCASQNDQLVQIAGEFSNVQDALYNATGRLRDNLFSGTQNSVGTTTITSVLPDTSPHRRLRDPAPVGVQPAIGVSHSLSRHTMSQNIDHVVSRYLDHTSSPGSWASRTVSGINSGGVNDIGRGFTSLKGGLELGSGSKIAMVTNTTVEIVVPDAVIGSVYGENGSNLARLRKISGAKVIVHEPHPRTRDRTIVISGTPDETQAAQSLLQAFILTGSS